LPEAKKYYHITENIANIPDLSAIGDDKLPSLLDHDDARQVLHVTYGQILTSAEPAFKEPLYATLFAHEEEYYTAVGERIEKHLPF
jgi:hypothetical protein